MLHLVKLFCVPNEIKGPKKFEAEIEILAAVEKTKYMCPVWSNQASYGSVDSETREGTDATDIIGTFITALWFLREV